MEFQIPQGMLSTHMAVEWLARRNYPDSLVARAEHEEAWRELCRCALEKRIRPYVLTESGESYEADRAQFAGMQERYIFHAEWLRYGSVEEQNYQEITDISPPGLRDVRGEHVRGRLCFLERDLEAAFCAEASPEEFSLTAPRNKPLPAARRKSRPSFERARGVIEELYPEGVPSQDSEPNKIFCGKVSTKLKETKLPKVSNDTILRAAGRRK